ncbi:MAG: hypothetical protein AMJ92_03910 [candidate division Zixibacteria bacterium SM23_81]|nr:MAG: hypothetical protein AMJ92_03910 [candidate division Zixibacteria bacterium SM23_81]
MLKESSAKRKPKIMIIGSIPPPYHGCTIAIQNLLNSRIKEEFDLLHLDTSDHRDFKNLGKFDLINISLALKNLLQLAFTCIFKKPDAIYVLPGTNTGSCLREGLFIILTKLLGNSIIISHFRTSYFKNFYYHSKWIYRRFIDFFLKRTNRAIVLGECLRPMVEPWFPVDRVDVIPNGTAFDPYPGGKVIKSFDHNNPVQLTYMSNIDPTKGVLILLEAIKNIFDHTQPFQLTIAGAWTSSGLEVKKKVEGFINQSSLREVVRFAGIVAGKTKEELLKETDIFVLPTFYPVEAHPHSIIEAMAAGCPVISTWHAAIPETVIHGETGILVEKENVEELARALKRLIEHPELRRKMGLTGRRRYEQFYTMDINISNMITVFKKALGAYTVHSPRVGRS